MALPDPAPTPALRLLFVCSGNTCRSPMAEALARRFAQAHPEFPLEVRSAGTSTLPGLGASEGATRAGERHGLDLGLHRSDPLTPELVGWAHRILVMGPGHLRRVREMGGGGKSALLGAYAREGREEGNHLAVPDPFGGDDRMYEETFMVLEDYVERALTRLEREGVES